ncbi:hypothetical protein QYM36_006102 [Artemia franciscana]|uniref:Uncharacterized protein n=1 Tax=Artemia franciscana TaxID=6661 RepID=A0AA88IBT6_ARTSF|nr:hypothetical protein QYM36_006102 [Artemia franciscana]
MIQCSIVKLTFRRLHPLVVVAENLESCDFPPLKASPDLSSDESDCVIVLGNLSPGFDSSLNRKFALDTFFKKATIRKVAPYKDKLRVHIRTAEAVLQLCDEAAVLFQPSTQTKTIPNLYLGLIRNYRADLDIQVIADCNPALLPHICESTIIKIAFKNQLDLEKALKGGRTVDYEFHRVFEYK